MHQRKRLLKSNRRPVDSFDQATPINSSESNVLSNIQNQNLYLKLVGIALEMSREAGVAESILSEVETKLLNAKGLQEYSMLNQEKKKIINKAGSNKQLTYNLSKKYIDPEEQLSFLNRMEKEVQQVQAKQHIIYALKKYIEQKKKSIGSEIVKNENITRVRAFIQKVKGRLGRNKIQRSNFYGQTLRQIIGRIEPQKCRVYETLKKMVHLKTLWGHTFFSEAQEQYCPVYNVIFDNSEKLILTGGEDGKLKVWSRQTGALISTLQGHKDYINKIWVSKNNKLLFSAAQDGVRFFDLDTMTSLGGYSIDCIMDIGQVFSKTTQKSSIIFANHKKLFVLPYQTIISQNNRKLEPYDFKIYNFGSKINQNTINTNTLTINPQGIVFLGFTQGQILIFDFNKLDEAEIDEENFSQTDQIRKIPEFVLPIICVLNAHEGDILQIKWNPLLCCFSTGAKKDGVCKIWEFKGSADSNRPIVVKQLKIPKYKMKRKKKVYNCNFGCWNSSYTHITCSFDEQQQQQETENRGDGQVIVYNAMKNQVTWEMSKTIDLSSIRAMDPHPFYSNIMAICDSSGKIMLADIYENYIINIFQERAFHLNHPSFCLVITECRFSQDGLNLLVATQYGNISIYGYDIKDFYHVYPTQQFFTNDYEEFQIDTKTFKPVLDTNTSIDVNLLNRGDLENIRHQPYNNLIKIDAKQLRQLIQNPISKQKHRNCFEIPYKEVQRIAELYLDHDRNFEILRQNIEQIEGKRMTILFQERQSRELELRKLIQEKIQKIKQIDQGISLNLVSNAFTSQNTSSNGGFSQIQNNSLHQGQENGPRRRGRRSTRTNVQSANSRISNIANYSFQQQQQNHQQQQNRRNHHYEEQEQYQAEGQASEDEEIQSQEEGDDEDFDEDNQSDQILPNGRSRRRRNIPTRRNHPQERRPVRNLRRRPANVEIQELQNEYEQFGRIRKRGQEEAVRQHEEVQDQHQQQARRQIRKAANRSLSQMRQQRQLCQLCQTREATVTCSDCRIKRYCDNCRSFRGKKTNQNTTYVCFQCFYLQNMSPQMYKNVSYEKYVMPSRTDFFVPQIGDEVAYFFQGYQQFLYDKIQTLNNKYKDLQIYFQIVPHQNHPELTRIQKCIITDVSYAFPLEQSATQISYHQSKRGARGRSYRSNVQDILTLLTLKTISGLQFRVFHAPGYQFLLKWQIYEDIITNDRYGKFKLFDVVRIKQEEIQIMEIKALNLNYSKSIWKNIIVHKAQSKYLRRSRDKNDDIAINIWNIDGFIDPKAFQYRSTFNQAAIDHYKAEIQRVEHKDRQIWDIFYEFVDSDQYPTYNQYVETSMCLRLILERLQNNYYVSEQSFVKDVKMLNQNSILFNGKQTQVTAMSQKLVKMILEGENFNNSNQIDQTTEKKGKPKRKLNSSGSFNRQPEQQERSHRRKPEIKVSRFEQQEDGIHKKPAKKYRQIQQSVEDYQQESEEAYSSDNSEKINTRTRRRNAMHHSKRQQNVNSRVTRSRTKH